MVTDGNLASSLILTHKTLAEGYMTSAFWGTPWKYPYLIPNKGGSSQFQVRKRARMCPVSGDQGLSAASTSSLASLKSPASPSSSTSSPLLVISTFSPFPKKPNFLPQSLCPLCSLLSAILFLQLPQGLSSDVTTLERIFLTHRMVKLCRAPAHPFRVYKDGDQVCFVPHCTSRA